MTTYQTDDGWKLENIQPLQDAVNAYEDMSDLIYELNNCVRRRDLVSMRDELKEGAENILAALEQIGDDDEVVEAGEDEDD